MDFTVGQSLALLVRQLPVLHQALSFEVYVSRVGNLKRH